MIIRSLQLLSAALLFVAVLAAPVLSQSPDDARLAQEVRQLLEQRDREIKTLLKGRSTIPAQDREKLKTMINDIIDFRSMSRQALGPHWSELTAAQQNEFVDVFSEIVRTQSLSNLDVYRTNVKYEQIEVTGSKAHVATSVVYKDVPTRVDYVMSFHDGAWHVDDIILDDVSTAEGYARSFQPVVKRRGFDTLMTSLRKKLEKVSVSGS